MAGDLAGLVSRLEAVTSRLEKVASKGGGAAGGSGADDFDTEIVDAFDAQVIGRKLKTYMELSAELGGQIAEHSKLVNSCFNEERTILFLACKHRQPKPEVLSTIVKPLSVKLGEVVTFFEKNRGSKFSNHLNTVKEGISCVGWVTVSPKPGPYVQESNNQSLFYGNRVLKEYKGKNDKHVEWMRAYTGAILELKEYVISYHKTGLTWNPQGSELTAAPAPPSAGGPPPPPPPVAAPPPPPPVAAPSGGGDDSAALKANLFASLNKGADVTKGLKKVTNDMKTYKNPELRASSVVKADNLAKKPAAASKKAAAPAVKKPPVCELQGQKWIVEYQEDNSNLVITPTDPKQLVYMYRCSRCTLKVNGKLNCVSIDSCKRVGVVIDEVISCVESINCQSVQIQVVGACPTVSIDKTDGCQVFLSKKSIGAEIVSAKSSEMNICIPTKDDEFVERAVPEQFKTTWDGKKLVTTCTDINA